MPIPQLNFGRTSVVDPTQGALQAVTSARNTLSDTMGQWAREEELDRQNARQKIQDDRATTAYNQQQQELTDRQKFGQAMLGDTQMRYADANAPGSEIMARMKNVELTPEELALSNKGMETPAIATKLKAQMELGQQFDNTGIRETEWEKAQRLAKELKVGGSAGVQERLYGIKAADIAARTKKEAEAKEARNMLLAKRDKLAEEMRGYSVVEKGPLSGKSGKNGDGKSGSDMWTPKDNAELQEEVDKLSLFGKGGDTTQGEKLLTYMKAQGVGPKQARNILGKMNVGAETLLTGEILEDPNNPDATPEQVMQYGRELIDAAAKGKPSTDGGSGGTYTKKDNTVPINLLKAELNAVNKQLSGLGGTNYDVPTTTPEERSMEKMNSLAQKLWSDTPATGEKPSKSTGKTTSTKIPGKIGAAISSSAPGDVARVSLLPEFASEYEELTKSQQARVDKVLQSKASQNVYATMKETLPVVAPAVQQTLQNGWVNTPQGYIYRGGKDNFPKVSTERLKALLGKANSAEEKLIRDTLINRGIR